MSETKEEKPKKSDKTNKRDNRVTLCMITQQIEQYTSGQFVGRPANEIANDIISKLTNAQIPIVESHTIIHDKDMQKVWSVKDECYLTTPKTPHFHSVVKFPQRTSIKQIADALGIEQQYVERQKTRGEHALSNMLAYLIHAKDKDKHQYDWREVASTVNAPFQSYYEKYKHDWEHGANVKIKKVVSEQIDDIEHDILVGTLTKQQILLDDNLFDCYARNKRRIDDAFDSYMERKMMKTMQSMKNKEFCKTVYYVTGSAGVGKSCFTKQLVDSIVERMRLDGENWSVCSCASTNPFDEYDGSEILVMDDVRSCALNASDWLKLLDNYNISVGSARYHNRVVAPRVIIINSERDVLEFFYYVKGNGKDGARAEAIDQFFRRILSVIEVLDIEDLIKKVNSFKEKRLYAIGSKKMQLVSGSRSTAYFPNEELCDSSLEFLQSEVKKSPVLFKDNVLKKCEENQIMNVSPKRDHEFKQKKKYYNSYKERMVEVDDEDDPVEVSVNYSFDFDGKNFKTINQIINEKVNEVYNRNHLKKD